MLFKKETKNYTVNGMHCGGCAKRVTEALMQIPSVKKVNIDLESKNVEVVYAKELSDEAVKSAIEKLGFAVI